jgi:ribosome-associated translation inhibitor RaiA
MKLLKTIFLFLALVCAGNSYGQTKEETIAWLKEKFANAHLFDFMEPAKQKVKIESINECEVVFTYESKREEDGGFSRDTIPFANLKMKKTGDRNDEKSIGNMAKAIKSECETCEKTINDSSSGIEIEETEVDLFSRIEKAAAHLATFCAKNKQAF